MSAPPDLPGPEDGFESDDPADYLAEEDRPDCNICCDFNPKYLDSDDSNEHRYSSLVRSSRDGCFTCKMLEEIITGLYKFDNASLVAFSFTYEDLELWNIGGGTIGSIELHQAADTSCPWGLVHKEINHPKSTASRRSLSWAKKQIQTCLAHHTGCGDPIALLPTRVIDVGTSGSETIKILETKGLRGKYVTLSHCWGKLASMPKLTAHTRDRCLEGIPCEALPRTFRDAVMITRYLNIRYLWIDSLCIIQKDDEKDTPQDKNMHQKDWEHESGRMCSVYQNCYLTLAGLDSPNCDGGLFFKRDKVRVEGDSGKGQYCFDGYREIEHFAVKFPLLLRGWVKQETLLSPRTLFCGKEELIWQCRAHAFCQCKHFRGDETRHGSTILSRGFRKLPLMEHARDDLTRPNLINT
ncbi:HET domain-containing protein [Fusarium keratoplasticum]|nr:HET domain-containing protein [Fusarium keratoplasticum]